jgi:hypothetical protein
MIVNQYINIHLIVFSLFVELNKVSITLNEQGTVQAEDTRILRYHGNGCSTLVS